MKKRVVAVMLIAVMTTLLAVGCGEKNSNQKEENSTKTEDTQKELEKITVTEPVRGILWAPVYAAKELGYFEEEGLDVDITAIKSDRGLLICGASPAIMYPNQQLWHEVYEKLECFVVLERYMSEDAKYADIILPSTTFYEYESIVNIRDGMRLRKQMIEPLGEAKADVFILQGIAENMGFGDVYPKTKEELLLWMCKGDKELLENLIRNE